MCPRRYVSKVAASRRHDQDLDLIVWQEPARAALLTALGLRTLALLRTSANSALPSIPGIAWSCMKGANGFSKLCEVSRSKMCEIVTVE